MSWESISTLLNPVSLVWHESGRSVALDDFFNGVAVIDLKTGQYGEYFWWARDQRARVVAGEFGWLVGRPDQFMALSHAGHKLGVLPLKFGVTNEPDGQENWVGTWILADGRTHPQAVGERYFVGRRGAEFVTIPLHQPIGDTSLPDLPTYPADASFDDLFR